MNYLLKRSVALSLLVFILMATFPSAAWANDDETVLTSIYHSSAAAAIDISGSFSATLTVPYASADSVDLSSGLDISYDTSVYSTAIASFPAGSTAVVDGDPVEMTVTYQKQGEEILYTSTYSINLIRAAYSPPEFSGTVSKANTLVTLPGSISFSAADFNTKYTPNDGGSLDSVVINGSNPTFGSLKLGDSDYSLGEKISTSDLGNLTFAATDTGTVAYTVSAYAAGDDDNMFGPVVLNITVDLVTSTGTIAYSTDKNTAVKLNATDFNTALQNATGFNLSYVKFTLPSASYGKLYYDYTSSSNYDSLVSANTEYYKSTAPYLSYISFVPYTGYTGTVSIAYTAYTTEDRSYVGTLNITVNDTGDSTVTYSTDNATPKKLVASDFNTACTSITGNTLSYVKFTLPSSSYGKLYYNYTSSSNYDSLVSASTKYYRSDSPYISYISFVPNVSYTGTVLISYTGYDTEGDSYSGELIILVADSGDNTITCSTDNDTPVKLVATDFNTACKNATGETLSYVKFSLPSSSYGRLYYDYTSSSNYDSLVSASTKYYRSKSPYISYISFVPNDSYTGTVSISYTGYDTEGVSYSGKLKITVTGSSTITYSTDNTTPIKLVASDFNTACKNATGETLSYVKFTLPSSTYGKLYYDYTSSSNYDAAVSASTKYYRSDSPYISYISFVPKSGYTGTVSISYTGYDTEGTSYSGKLKITVTNSGSTTVTYSTDNNTPVKLVASDFNTACKSATGETLSYVKFTLPSSTYGKLYYDYTSTSNYDAAVSASTKYYRSASPYISYISFVPKSGYAGTVSISYTGYNTEGTSYSGKLKITVIDTGSSSRYFNDVGNDLSWAVEAIDYLYEEGVVTGIGSNRYLPNSSVTRGDFMLMLYRALNLKATAKGNFSDVPKGSYYYDAIAAAKVLGIAQGDGVHFYPNSSITRQDAMVLVTRSLETARITIPSGSSSDLRSFADRGMLSDYAAAAVASLVKAGIIKGDGTRINPRSNITRAEMAVILQRVLDL